MKIQKDLLGNWAIVFSSFEGLRHANLDDSMNYKLFWTKIVDKTKPARLKEAEEIQVYPGIFLTLTPFEKRRLFTVLPDSLG